MCRILMNELEKVLCSYTQPTPWFCITSSFYLNLMVVDFLRKNDLQFYSVHLPTLSYYHIELLLSLLEPSYFAYSRIWLLQQLAELGVERLVLPAIPSVLNAWITSFGFSKMDESERLNFLAYTFLDFQGTVFCQKMLKIDLSMVLSLPAGEP